jgi:hypothetical protein
MRLRRYALVEDCAELRVSEFSPIVDDSVTHTKRLFMGAHPIDFEWSVDFVGATAAGLNTWYYVYRDGVFPRIGRRGSIADDRADVAHEHRSARVRLSAAGSSVGERRWYLHCPVCSARCASLFISPVDTRLGCRRCLHLKYASQVRGRRGAK